MVTDQLNLRPTRLLPTKLIVQRRFLRTGSKGRSAQRRVFARPPHRLLSLPGCRAAALPLNTKR
jgi:hypothetical protein